MNKYTIIALVVITTIMSACNKQDRHYEVNCEPVEIPTYGFGTQLTFQLQSTDTRRYLMTFSNTHDYPIVFSVAFPVLPGGIRAVIEQNNFSLVNTRNHFVYVTLTTDDAKTGKYEVPVEVTTDNGGNFSTLLEITVADNTGGLYVDERPEIVSYELK